jgi:toxin ParE1/3/4
VSANAVVRRAQASADIAAAVSHYLDEAESDLAERFIDEVEGAIGVIAEAPGTGSPRFGDMLRLPGLRSRRVAGFPFLVFYIETDQRIEVWRVLHERRDIAGTLLDMAP